MRRPLRLASLDGRFRLSARACRRRTWPWPCWARAPVLVRPPGHAAPDARTQGHVLGAAARMDRAAAAAPLRAIRHPDPPAMGSALPGRAEHAHRPGQRRALCARAARQPGRQARSQRPAAALHRLVGVVAGRRRAAPDHALRQHGAPAAALARRRGRQPGALRRRRAGRAARLRRAPAGRARCASRRRRPAGRARPSTTCRSPR